jgi:hypothetical protein
MAHAWLTAGAAFVAFCVWLAMRIINRRERWTKWTLAATLCMPVVYVPSIGPATWLVSHGRSPQWGMNAYYYIYLPLLQFGFDNKYPRGRSPFGSVLFSYLEKWGDTPNWVGPRLHPIPYLSAADIRRE